MGVGNRLSMTSKNAHAYRADAATRGLWHLDVGRGGFTVPDAEFETDPDTALLYHLGESGPPIMDSSDNGNDGTLSGDPGTLAEGRFGDAVEFDGIDDTVRAPDAQSLEPGAEDFTVEAFVKLGAEAPLPATVVARWNEQLEMRAYRLFIDIDGHLAAEVSTDGTAGTVTGLVGTTAVAADEWHHVVLQRKGDVLSLWLDGEREAEADFAASVFDGAEELIAGAVIDVNGNPADVFTGVIDEVRVSVIARYPDEETPDSSGNKNHGGLWRGAGITAADEGRFDRALSLDGVDDYVEVPDDAALELGSSDFTVEAWVKPSDLAGLRVIVSKWADGEASYRLYLDGGIPRLDLSSDGAAVYTLSGTAAVPVDEWTHVAATRNGTTVKLIVNDAPVATGTFAEALHDGPAPVRFGACSVEGAEGFFAGLIDEVRVSDINREGALGTVEVSYTYNARNQLVTETCGTSVRTYGYDPNGNTVSIVETVNGVPVAAETMTYDALNRMLSYAGRRGSESFTYRGAKWHRFSANGTGFLYDGANVLLDIGGAGGGTFYVTPLLDQNLSMTRSGATHYYSQDGLGSVRTLTDSLGSAKNRYDYNAFGSPFALGRSVTVKQRYTYAGREAHQTGPLYHFRHREYDPRAGRFWERDPILQGTYVYGRNNPIALVDPYGLLPRWAFNCNPQREVPIIAAYAYKGLGGGGSITVRYQKCDCCTATGELVEDMVVWAELSVAGRLGFGIGGTGKVLGLELGAEVVLWHVDIDLKGRADATQCGMPPFEVSLSKAFTVSAGIEPTVGLIWGGFSARVGGTATGTYTGVHNVRTNRGRFDISYTWELGYGVYYTVPWLGRKPIYEPEGMQRGCGDITVLRW